MSQRVGGSTRGSGLSRALLGSGVPERGAITQRGADGGEYAYRFGGRHVRIVKRALPCGDYAVILDQRLVASVECKSLIDLLARLIGGKLPYAMAELAALPPRRGRGSGPLLAGIQGIEQAGRRQWQRSDVVAKAQNRLP